MKVGDLVLIDKRVRGTELAGKVHNIVRTTLGDTIVIVEIEGGELVKVFAKDVTVIHSFTEDEDKSESKDTVTISREELKNAVFSVVEEFTKGKDPSFCMMLVLFGALIGKEVEKVLFRE